MAAKKKSKSSKKAARRKKSPKAKAKSGAASEEYGEGAAARRLGRKIEECPYKPGSKKAERWERGYLKQGELLGD